MDKTPVEMLDYLKSRGCWVGGITLGERACPGTTRPRGPHLAGAPDPARARARYQRRRRRLPRRLVYSYCAHPGKSWHDHLYSRAPIDLQDRAPRQRGRTTDAADIKWSRWRSRPAHDRIKPGREQGRVFVAGSINMDVVATADRHPSARPSPATPCNISRRQGRNQAVAAAKSARRPR